MGPNPYIVVLILVSMHLANINARVATSITPPLVTPSSYALRSSRPSKLPTLPLPSSSMRQPPPPPPFYEPRPTNPPTISPTMSPKSSPVVGATPPLMVPPTLTLPSPTDANARLPRIKIPKIRLPKLKIPDTFIRTPAAEGKVYCNCPTSPGSSPLAGATVEINCRRNFFLKTKRTTSADEEGNFFVLLPVWVTNGDCTAVLGYAPMNSPCRFKTALNGGISGASLTAGKRLGSVKVYNVGPFAFSPFGAGVC